jgi:hypothetical protein
MPEIMFILKSMVVTILVMMALQAKVGNSSMEDHLHLWIQTSSISKHIHEVSSGAVQVIHNATKSATDFVAHTFGHDTSVQKAGRLNFEIKRSQKYQDEKAEKESAD